MNINNKTLAELATQHKSGLLNKYYRNQTKKQHLQISSLTGLLDTLPCYRQILMIGGRQSHPQDFLREILIRALEQQLSCLYITSAQEAENFIPYYCLRRHNIGLENLQTGNLTREELDEVQHTLDILQALPLSVVWPKHGCRVTDGPQKTETGKLWVISSLASFYPPNSAEDKLTQTMSILNNLKQQAEQTKQTHLIWLETEQNTLDGVIRSEGLQLADLVLNLQVAVKDQRVIYELTSYKNILGQSLNLTLSYHPEKHLFTEAK